MFIVSLDISGIQTVAKNSWPCHYFLCLAFSAAEFASAAALARVVGLKMLYGLKAFLIFNTAQAVPIACPAASSPSFVTCPACSPYLQWWKTRPSIFSFLPIILKRRTMKTGHKHYILAKTRSIPNTGDSFCCFPKSYLFYIELLSKKERSNGQVQTKLQELGILDGILVYGAQLKIRFST